MHQQRAPFIFLAAFFTLINAPFSAQPKQAAGDIIKAMHKRYVNGPCKSYTFSQRNQHYRNDSIVRRSEWHEAIEFPDKFRIDFGDKAEKNFVVFKNDSAFNYKKGELVRARADSNILLLLLGGMYYRNLNDVMARIKNSGLDVSVLSVQTWNNKPVYVLGAKENDLLSNQVWVDKKTLTVLRIIEKLTETSWMDLRFETHQPWCKGTVESKVSFRRNGKLEQVEEYYDIKESNGFQE